jgi:hypothetical protein
MASNDVWRITVTGTMGASTALISGHFRLKAATPEPNNASLAAVAQDFIQVFRPVQDGTFGWRTWKAIQVRASGVSYVTRPCLATGGRGEEGTFTTNYTGSAPASEPLPPQCSLVTTLKSQLIGRTRRGRVFIPCLTEFENAAGAWTPATTTAIAASWATFMTKYGFSPAGTDPLYEYGIWSMRIATGCVPRKEPPYGMQNIASPNPDDAYVGILSVVPRSTVFTQRRRVAGHGI